MKLQHSAYANQKLQTEWGVVEADADGCVTVSAEAGEFFAKTLKFQPVDAAAIKAARVEEKVANAQAHAQAKAEIAEAKAEVELLEEIEEEIVEEEKKPHSKKGKK